MRKSFFLTLALAVLSVFTLVFSARTVSTGKELTAEPVEVQGDAESAGILLSLRAACGGKLEWTAEYSPEAGMASDFSFHTSRLKSESQYSGGELWLSVPMNFGISSSGGIDLDDGGYFPTGQVRELVKDVASRTASGSERKETVLLSDYCEFLPFEVNANLRAMFADENGDLTSFAFAYEDELTLALREYFKIPTPKNMAIEITVKKDIDGDIYDVSCEAESSPGISCASLETDAGLYFALSFEYSREALDLSLIPGGGNGVYFIPFEQEGELLRAHPERIEPLFPLDAETIVNELLFSAAGDLVLQTYEQGKSYLRVVDASDGTEKQRLCIDRGENARWRMRYDREDYYAFIYSDGSFAVFELGSDGIFTQGLSGQLPEAFAGNRIYSQEYTSVDYDGERFAIAYLLCQTLSDERSSPPTCDVAMAVFDGGGLVYYEQNSSSLKYIDDMSYKLQALPFGNEPVKISLQ